MNGDGLGGRGWGGPQEGGGQGVRKDHGRKSPELGMRMGDWTWRNGVRGEDLQLAYLLPWMTWSMDSQAVPVGVGARIKQ